MHELRSLSVALTPNLMLAFAFWASLLLTLLKIASFFKRPSLDLRLAPEAFFRVSDFGECLFCTPIYLAWNGPVLITGATAELNKTGIKTKRCPFRIHSFGEKVKSGTNQADFYFHSSSPIQHVDEGRPQRVVYLMIEDSQSQLLQEKFLEVGRQALSLKEEVKRTYPMQDNSSAKADELVKHIVSKCQALADQFSSEIMDLVQLEPGSYVFSVEVSYVNPKKILFRRTTSKRASLTFEVGADVRTQLRVKLNNALYTLASNLISGKTVPYLWPEYLPTNIRIA
jgi:hypothetical protein